MSDPHDPSAAVGPGEPPESEQLLTVGVRTRDRSVVVSASGEIDVLTVPRFADALTAALHVDPEATAVICDLTDVTFIASRGLTALLDAAIDIRGTERTARFVVRAGSGVARALKISGIDQSIAVYDSVDAAVATHD